jgi:hypothetical protein
LDVKFSNVGVYTFTFTARDAVGNANSASVPADAQICVT